MSLKEIVLGECRFEFNALLALTYESHSLRNELLECRTSAETREEELLVEIQDLQRRVEELAFTPSHTSFWPDESERFRDEYRGSQNDVEYLIDDDSSLFDPTPTLIPDTKSRIKGDDDPHTPHFCFRDPIVDLESEVGGQQSGASSGVDIAHSGLKLGDREFERLVDVADGEAPMMLATPIIPASLLGHESPDGSAVAAAMVNGEVGHDGILYEDDNDRDRREELEGTSDGIEFDEVDDDDEPDQFVHELAASVGIGESDSHSRTISDDGATSPSVNYSASRETSIDDDGDGDEHSGHDDRCVFDDEFVNLRERQVPRDHGDQQSDHARDQEE